MSGRVQVVVATTEGPSTVLRVTAEDPTLRSVVCLGRSTTVLPISRAYDAFVRSPTGIVERAVGHAAFRVDVSAPIDDGESWQLGLYIAHRLKAADRLAEDDQPAELVLWVSGAVDGDLQVHPVDRLDTKLRRSAELFAAAGSRLTVVIPAGQRDALGDLCDGLRTLESRSTAAVLSDLELESPQAPVARRRVRWPLVGLAVALAVTVAVALAPRPSDSPPVRVPGPAVPTVVAAPTFEPSAVTLTLLEARPADGASCGAGDRLLAVAPGQQTPPGVCAVAARVVNAGAAPGFVWLAAMAEGTFREYAGGSRAVEIAVGAIGPGEAAEVRVAAPSWVRRPVVFRVLLVLSDREHEQVTRSLAAVDLLSAEEVDRLTGQFIGLGLGVRTLRHRVQPRR